MTGSDLIVAAPWILFAIGLAIIYIRLLRVRHAGRQPPRQSGPRTPGPADPGRAAAGSPAPTDGPRNHQLPLPIGRSMLDEQRAQPAAPAAVPPAGRGGPRWRALLEDRWQARLREVTELSLAYHQATDVIPDGHDAGEGGPVAVVAGVETRPPTAAPEGAGRRRAASHPLDSGSGWCHRFS